MLQQSHRRVAQRVVLGGASSLAALCTPQRAFATTRALANSNSNSNSRNTAEEDREELERERQLRERFAQKVQHGAPIGPGAGAGMDNMGGMGSMPMGGPQMSADAPRKAFNFFFYLTALLFLLMLAPLANQNNPAYTLQGIAWWQLPITSSAYYLLLRSLYPRGKTQSSIKNEFEDASRQNPTLTFDQFIARAHPDMFQGYRTSQPELVAAVAACLADAKDLKFAQSMVRAAGRAADPKASADAIMDSLRRDFSHLF